jgi:polyketide cyclase/dehydrase/lipid transport protein
MASIRKEIVVEAPAGKVWDAVRDVGAVHTRLARGMVRDTRVDGDSRFVTFANGETVRERIVDVDDRSRRLAYAVVGWRTTHHHASFEVVPDGDSRSRVIWIADLLPDELASLVDGLMEQGSAAIKATLEAGMPVGERSPG